MHLYLLYTEDISVSGQIINIKLVQVRNVIAPQVIKQHIRGSSIRKGVF